MKKIIFAIVMFTLLVTVILPKATASKWGERKYSPDNEFYIEYYSVFTFKSLLPVTPGNGSDNIDGYIRLYNKNEELLKEVYMDFLMGSEVRIDNEDVYSTRTDGFFWNLDEFRNKN